MFGFFVFFLSLLLTLVRFVLCRFAVFELSLQVITLILPLLKHLLQVPLELPLLL